jgi:hypothetical protein
MTGLPGKVADVRNSPLLVHDQILDEVHVLGPGLPRQTRWRIPVRTAVIHVDMEITAVPAFPGHIPQPLETHAEIGGGIG